MNALCIDDQGALPIDLDAASQLVTTFLKWKNVQWDEVIICFVTKESISKLHAYHFDDPTPTDCITFPIDSPKEEGEGPRILGEVFVCPEVAIEYTQKEGGNPYEEVSLYVIHGLLHLLGFDDIEKEDREEMRREEKSAIEYLKKNKVMLHD